MNLKLSIQTPKSKKIVILNTFLRSSASFDYKMALNFWGMIKTKKLEFHLKLNKKALILK